MAVECGSFYPETSISSKVDFSQSVSLIADANPEVDPILNLPIVNLVPMGSLTPNSSNVCDSRETQVVADKPQSDPVLHANFVSTDANSHL